MYPYLFLVSVEYGQCVVLRRKWKQVGSIFLNKCKYLREELSGLFLRLFSFFFLHFIRRTDHKASQPSSKAWYFWSFFFLFSSVPDGSTDWISSEGHTINIIFSHTICYSIGLVSFPFPWTPSSIRSVFYSVIPHASILSWKRLKPTLNVLRSDSQILYCTLKRQIVNTIFF